MEAKLETGKTSTGNDLFSIRSLRSYMRPQTVVVMGCGGTGAYVAAYLTRLIGTCNPGGLTNDQGQSVPSHKDIKIVLVDGDNVEEKNLKRQHFIGRDIGRNKAEVLAERYSAAFGVEIQVIPRYLEKADDFHSFPGNVMVVGCVDNNATRKMIHEWFSTTDSYNTPQKFWVDSGNEERNGQVVCGFAPKQQYGYYNDRVNNKKLFSLPSVAELYPEVLTSEDKFASEESCAERAESAPQNVQTNVTAATLVMNYIQKALLIEPIDSCCVEFSIDNSFSVKHNTEETLNKVNAERLRRWEKRDDGQ